MAVYRVLRNTSRRFAYPIIEAFWGAGFRLTGALYPPGKRVKRWTSSGGFKVTVVAAHPDDETVGAGGVSLLHRQADDTVTTVVVTDGRASRAGGHSPEAMAQRRGVEVEAACGILDVDLIRLDCRENEWGEAEVVERLRPLLEDSDIVYAPSCVDFHPEHVRVARAVASIVRPEQIVRVYEISVPLTSILVNLTANIDDVASLKDRAMRSFETQTDALRPIARLARHRARRYGFRAVEVFWEMSGASYYRLMADTHPVKVSPPFRSIRSIPVTDPVASAVGRAARRDLFRRVKSYESKSATL